MSGVVLQKPLVIDGEYIKQASPLIDERYSPNLFKWVRRQLRDGLPLQIVYGPNCADGESDKLFVGQLFDDGWFHGAPVWRILGAGLKAEVYAYSPAQIKTYEGNFIAEYLAIGRCALDADHSHYFLNADHRFNIQGDDRQCNWCGHKQKLVRWTETKERSRWEASQ